MDYTTYEEIDLTEQKMTNSILGVTLENAPKIYFLTGHSEYEIDNYFGILTRLHKHWWCVLFYNNSIVWDINSIQV